MKQTRIEAYSETILFWPNGVPPEDRHIVERAERCEEEKTPFHMHDTRWVVTYVGGNHGEDDDFVIEGIEMIEGLE